MLNKNNRIISYICPECGLPIFKNISLFDFSGKKEIIISCKCNKSHLKISTYNHKKYSLDVPCLGCGSIHKYQIGFVSMWEKSINIIKCKTNHTEILFCGYDKEVMYIFDKLEEEKDEVARIIGFERVYLNSTVMLQAINKVHEFCENNAVICECGYANFEIDIKEDVLLIKCKRCNAIGIIKAKSSIDLKELLQKESVFLCKNKKYI